MPARLTKTQERSHHLSGADPVLLVPAKSNDNRYSGHLIVANAPDTDLALYSDDSAQAYMPDRKYDHKTQLTTLYLQDIPVGYYSIRASGKTNKTYRRYLFIHPATCYLPDNEQTEKALMVQLYALRNNWNWGIGDFTDLAILLKQCEGHYHYIGLNPLHALDPNNPSTASPYSPDSRILFNEIYIDVAAAAEAIGAASFLRKYESHEFQAELSALRSKKLIDYERVYALKLQELTSLFQFFLSSDNHRRDTTKAFYDFVEKQDSVMRRLMRTRGLKRQALAHNSVKSRILFEYFLQWLCERQLYGALSNTTCKTYFDLAIGSDPNGVDLACYHDMFDNDRSLGAEPDEFCSNGQKWKIAPFDINSLRTSGYDLFRKMIRENIKFASALRIDNIASFYRRYTMHKDELATAGVYEPMPYKEFFAILAIESYKNQCIIIGEDLGSIPSGIRSAMRDWGILGCLVYQLEHEGINARTIEEERERNSVFSFSTHDCPPLLAYWLGRDIDINKRLKRITPEHAQEAKAQRRLALKNFSLTARELKHHNTRKRFLDALGATTTSRITAYVLDDLLGEHNPVNVPGTDKEYPNWRRKYRCEAALPLLT